MKTNIGKRLLLLFWNRFSSHFRPSIILRSLGCAGVFSHVSVVSVTFLSDSRFRFEFVFIPALQGVGGSKPIIPKCRQFLVGGFLSFSFVKHTRSPRVVTPPALRFYAAFFIFYFRLDPGRPVCTQSAQGSGCRKWDTGPQSTSFLPTCFRGARKKRKKKTDKDIIVFLNSHEAAQKG